MRVVHLILDVLLSVTSLIIAAGSNQSTLTEDSLNQNIPVNERNVQQFFLSDSNKTDIQASIVDTWNASYQTQPDHQQFNEVHTIETNSIGDEYHSVNVRDMRYSQSRRLLDYTSGLIIVNITEIVFSEEMILLYDPPSGHFSPTALGVYVSVVGKYSQTALVYYSFSKEGPTLLNSYATFTSPYIQVDTPFGASRTRTLTIVAIQEIPSGFIRSKQHTLTYYVESLSRPYSYGFFVPGIETSGYFLRVGLEEVATARAQIVGNQEFADFFNKGAQGRLGTYASQIQALHLPSLDDDLNGFEGGYAVFSSLIITDFFGKVVRVNMTGMSNATKCSESYRMESYNEYGDVIHSGNTNDSDACVTVIDLTTIHKNAKGFRRGFVGYPYAYLSPGEFDVAIRLDMENFGIRTVSHLDFSSVNSKLGGFSGGFVDGTWSCFNPFRTFYGPVGGLRSTLPVDQNQLRPYYHGSMVCVNDSAWTGSGNGNSSIKVITPANISPEYRGFSDAIRVGRYSYLCPYATDTHEYTGKLIRIYLGTTDIGNQIDSLISSGSSLSTIVDVLDLNQVNPAFAGFSSLFSSGQYIFLVPFRNAHVPSNGQRGHGYIVKVDMNNFELSGVTGLDLPVTTRNQIPSFADINLRGFSYGFASGKYAIFVPFYNGLFSGSCARIQMYGSLSLAGDLQELDFTVDRERPGVYKGFRGAFVSIWPGTSS